MIKLVKTCDACPEQYDAYFGGECIGYLRLRHGLFRTDYFPKKGHKVRGVYVAEPEGDGSFHGTERDNYLAAACGVLIALLRGEGRVPNTLYVITSQEEAQRA